MNQICLNLFYSGVQPSEIESMSLGQMKLYNEYYEIIQKTHADAVSNTPRRRR